MNKTVLSGACKYCGQIQNISAATQEEADKIATNRCHCPGARKAQKREAMVRNAKAINCEGTENISDLLITAGDMILNEEIQGITIAAGNIKFEASSNKDGYIKFQRTETKKQELQE